MTQHETNATISQRATSFEIDRKTRARVYLRNMGASEASINSFLAYLTETGGLKEWCDRRSLRPYRIT